jgi:thiol-disulfide isomerase/thioredoxin
MFFYCIAILNGAFSQETPRPIHYFDNFEKYLLDSPNLDSAFFYLKGLTLEHESPQSAAMAAELSSFTINNVLALEFAKSKNLHPDSASSEDEMKRRKFATKLLLLALSDTSQGLKSLLRPLYLTVQIEDNTSDKILVKKDLNKFIYSELREKNIYTNALGRYGVRIYELTKSVSSLDKERNQLFLLIRQQLETGQIKLTDSTTRSEFERRAWFRWMYAYINYIQAIEAVDRVKKENFLKVAYNYSPDAFDKDNRGNYFYDMSFLTGGEKESFKDDYLSFLLNKGIDKKSLMNILLEMALNDPIHKNRLQRFYDSTNATHISFEAYWAEAVNQKAKYGPPIKLIGSKGEVFTNASFKGKWVMIDFWGTWCPVCRMEHPDLQKFYDSTIKLNSNQISLVTIAVRDTPEKIESYMGEKHYTFPVAMTDGHVELDYHVKGYPTKLLITPQGKYIYVPLGVDWQYFVMQYCNLQSSGLKQIRN